MNERGQHLHDREGCRSFGRAMASAGLTCAVVAWWANAALASPVASVRASVSHVVSAVTAAPSLQYGRQITPLDQMPQSITLVEVLYEATRTLDAGGSALAAIGDAYAVFEADWSVRLPPKSRRMIDAADEADDAAAVRALAAAWADSDALHEALVARVIEACAATGAPAALDPTAQANFRGRIAHRVAFSDETSLSVDRLPIVTTPCVDLAIAVGHPRIQQRVRAERRAVMDALLASEWPRILAEHRELRRIGFEFGTVDWRTPIMRDAESSRASAKAEDDALRAIARLARANLAANLAFADRVGAEVGVDAADALRVELISNACRDGGFAGELLSFWTWFEARLWNVEKSRSLDAETRDAAARELRDTRNRMVLGCAASFRAFLAADHAFTSGLDGDEESDAAKEAALRGDHPFTEEIILGFRRTFFGRWGEPDLEIEDHILEQIAPPVDAQDDKESVAAQMERSGFTSDRELRADWRRFVSASDEILMAHEDESDRELARWIQQGHTEGASEDASGDDLAAAPRLSAADLRRAVGALRLDGVDRPKDEIEAVFAAFVASEPAAIELLARRSTGAPDAFGEVDAASWRSLPDDIAREQAFHASRMQTLRGAFDLPEQSAAAAVLSLERLDFLLGRSHARIGTRIPDDILAIATAAGIGIDDQRKLFVAALPAIDALVAELPAFSQRFRDAALADERAELAARAAFRARTGAEEGRMDVVERGGPVEEARGEYASAIRLAMARILLDAAWSIELDTNARLRFSLRIVESLSGCVSTGSIAASRTIRMLRGAAGDDAALVGRLDRCEQTVLEEPLAGLPAIADAGADAQRRDAAWKEWWRRWCETTLGSGALPPFTPGRSGRTTDAEGRRMLLMLQAVDGASNERHLQRIIAYAFSAELGRLRQTPFAETFFP